MHSSVETCDHVSHDSLAYINTQQYSAIDDYFIDIKQVRWFYKADKKKQATETSSSTSSSSSSNETTPSSSSIDGNEFTSSENSSFSDTIDTSYGSATESSSSSAAAAAAEAADDNYGLNLHHISTRRWIPFSKYDSFRLEVAFRHRRANPTNTNQATSATTTTTTSTSHLIQVLGDLYEVNLDTQKCYSIYWKSRTNSIMRSLWHTDDGDVLEENDSLDIERKHIELFKQQTSASAAAAAHNYNEKSSKRISKSEPIEAIKVTAGVVKWYSEEEIYLEKKRLNVAGKLRMGLCQLINRKCGVRIKRGFHDTDKVRHERMSYDYSIDHGRVVDESNGYVEPKEITHLVFVVPGIAQKIFKNRAIKNCELMRKLCEQKKSEYFEASSKERYLFVPVNWRSSLKLIDGLVHSLTPQNIPVVRDAFNLGALDIMYYTNPLTRHQIMHSLISELNRLYNLFCSKNAYFKEKHNKVSIIAHSLGVVVVYDAMVSYNSYVQLANTYGEDPLQEKFVFDHLSNNDDQLLSEYLKCKSKMHEIEECLVKRDNNISCLEFNTENFFCLGSPLSIYLALRGVRPAQFGAQDHILPKHICKRMFNIFHRVDPIAYRIEPLILNHYAQIPPVGIQKTSRFESTLSYRTLNAKRRTLATTTAAAASTSATSTTASTASTTDNNDSQQQQHLPEALDYQLQGSSFELLYVFIAHNNYWRSSDTILFILQQLCQGDG